MNIETREVRDEKDISPAEKQSGKWIPIRRKYVQKQPVSDAGFARIVAANERRERKNRARAKAAGVA